MFICKVCGTQNQPLVQACVQCGTLLNITDEDALRIQQQISRPRKRGRRRKHWAIQLIEGAFKMFFQFLMVAIRFIPRLIYSIIEGVSRI
jgi:hypothetical protein